MQLPSKLTSGEQALLQEIHEQLPATAQAAFETVIDKLVAPSRGTNLLISIANELPEDDILELLHYLHEYDDDILASLREAHEEFPSIITESVFNIFTSDLDM